MNKEKVILFGASKKGEIAYSWYSLVYDILFFVDNDKNKWMKEVNFSRGGGINEKILIYSPQKLLEFKNTKIIITSEYWKEIRQQLYNMGLRNIYVMNIIDEKYNATIHPEEEIVKNIKEINLGEFLYRNNNNLLLRNLTFIPGGSGVLDYLFLRALILKFQLKNYLEIGTFIGESLRAVSDICSTCYSISLNMADNYFRNRGEINFHKKLLIDDNIISFETNSNDFDYSLIDKKIDICFIDADHSYDGIYNDTKNIFDYINKENTFVIWHDFRIYEKYRQETIWAVKDALSTEEFNRVYSVHNNACGIYIPDKYINSFPICPKIINKLYSYNTKIDVDVL